MSETCCYCFQARKYSIVDVPLPNGEIEVTVVPHKWIHNGEVLCPSDRSKEAAASQAYADPDDSYELKECTVRKTYGSYEAARKKLPYAYDTDGLVSDKELGRGSRKKMKRKQFEFEDSDGETVKGKPQNKSSKSCAQQRDKPLPPPPASTPQSRGANLIALLQKKKEESTRARPTSSKSRQATSKNNTQSSCADVFSSEQHPPEKTATKVVGGNKPGSNDTLNVTKHVESPAKKQNQSQSFAGSQQAFKKTSAQTGGTKPGSKNSVAGSKSPPKHRGYVDRSISPEKYGSEIESESEQSGSESQQNDNQNKSESDDSEPKGKDDGVERELESHAKTLEERNRSKKEKEKTSIKVSPLHSQDAPAVLKRMLVKQQLILTKQVEMEHKLDLILGHVGAGDGASKPEGWPNGFPLTSMLSLMEFESALKEPEVYDFAVRHFSVVVGMGADPAGMAVDICARLFHGQKLAPQLNWQGSEAKKGIKKMKIGQLILDAVAKRYEGKFKSSSISGAISVWLRNRASSSSNL